MPDLVPPYVGNPNLAAQAARAAAFRRTHEDTWLDEFLGGLLGQEAQTSVLDPNRANNADANNIGQGVGNVLNLADPVKLMGGKALGLLGGAAGAIRLRGAKDLLATHAFHSHYAEPIVESGFLKAPSIGITARGENDYSAASPQLVFPAGKVEPSNYENATLVNRDGYFANPSGDKPVYEPGEGHKIVWSNKVLQDNIKSYLDLNKDIYGLPDLRLAQVFPGASQAMQIGASPSFKSLAEFEKSPYGAGALRQNKLSHTAAWSDIEYELRKQAGGWGDNKLFLSDLFKKVHGQGIESLTDEERRLWDMAQRGPSAMAELKILDKLPISPEDTAVLYPIHHDYLGSDTLDYLKPFRDAGYPIVTPYHYQNPGDAGYRASEWAGKRLPKIAPPEGGLNIPAVKTLPRMEDRMTGAPRNELVDQWNSFIEPHAGGSPPPLPRTYVPTYKETEEALLHASDMSEYHDILNEAPPGFHDWFTAKHDKTAASPIESIADELLKFQK